jgi:hypothetical protein
VNDKRHMFTIESTATWFCYCLQLSSGSIDPETYTALIFANGGIYSVIKNDCRGFNNLPYTIHLRKEYVVSMDQEILRFFNDVRCAVVMHFSTWSAVY